MEPDGLAIVRALARHLEMEVLLDTPLVKDIGRVELVLLVIGHYKVLKNSTRLPEREARVGVDDGGKTSIGVDLEEPFLLGVFDDNLETHEFMLPAVGEWLSYLFIWNTKFLENNDDLERVGAAGCISLS